MREVCAFLFVLATAVAGSESASNEHPALPSESECYVMRYDVRDTRYEGAAPVRV